MELLVGGTHNIVATTTPDGLPVSYTADDSGVVSVDADGKITALKEGTGTITVKVGGDGVYTEKTTTVTVHVTRVLDEGNITLEIPTGGYVYDGTAKTPAVTVKYGEKTLTKDQDYTVSYSNNVNAGDNTATVTVSDIAGGDYNVSGKKTFSIAKAPLTVKANDKKITYGDTPTNSGVTYTGFVTGEDENTDGIFGTSTLSYDYDYTQYGNVGETYTITPKGLTAANYAITFETGTLTVEQREVGLTWSPNPAEFTFNNSAQAPTANATNTVNSDVISVAIEVSAKSGSSLTGGKAVNVGNYTATATGLTSSDKADNYKLPATGLTQDFSITSATSVLTKTPVGVSNLTYNGSAQDLVSAGTATNGTVQYRLEGGTYSESIPTGTTAGTYKVYYKVVGNTNYADIDEAGPIEVTIAKAAITIKAKDQTITFGENIVESTDQVTITSGSLGTSDALKGITLTPSGLDVTDAGTIMPGNAVIKNGDNVMTENYNISYIEGALVINPSDVASAAVTAKNRAYDGTTQALVEIGTVVNGATNTESDVVFYENATSTTKLTGIPQGTNAGRYDVYYEVTPDANHSPSGRKQLTVTISPITAVVTITGHNNTAVYDGENHSVSGYDVDSSTPLYTEADFTFNGTATAERTVTGKTNMGLSADQFTNTNTTNFSEVTFNVTDGFQEITSRDGVIVTITGHSNTADYDGKEHSVSGYDVKISNPLYTEADFNFNGTASAARTDAGKTEMGLKESQFENKNTNFGTVTFIVTDGYQTISPITADVTITGHYNTTTYDGEEHSVSGYDVSFSNKLYKESYFTFSGTAEAARTDEGTTYMGLTKDKFSNTSQNFKDVNFTVIDGYQTITSVTDVVVTITGHSSTIDYDGEEHTVSDYDVEISNDLYKVTDFTFSGTAKATQKDAGTKQMGLAPSQFKNKNTDFTNVTFKVVDGFQTIKPITATVTINGHSNAAIYDGTEHSVTGYDVSFSNNLYKQTDFTFNGTAYAARTYKGKANMGLAESQFANISPNFKDVIFTVNDGYQMITPRTLTITANEQTIDYGTDIATDLTQVTAVGLQGSDKLSEITLAASLTALSSEITNDGIITPSKAKIKNGEADVTENYDITYNTGTLIIEYVLDLKAGYVTFCSPFDLMLTDGVKAYTVSAVSESSVELTEQKAIGKNVAMILYVENAGTFRLRKAAAQNFRSISEFIGVTDAKGIDVTTIGGEVYILNNNQFVWSRGGIIPQYRCYIVLSDAAGARSLSINAGEANGIGTVYGDPAMTDGTWYDLNGRKLDAMPTKKGLYIYKGKKTVIK